MAQHDGVIANAAGPTVRADINALSEALLTNNAGSSAPSPTWPHMWWPDLTANRWKRRNAANTAWIDCGPIDEALLKAIASEVIAGTEATKAITAAVLAALWKKGTDIASATTPSVPADGGFFHLTGTTPTTGWAGRTNGPPFWVEHDAATPLTHNATSFALLTAANLTAAAGDFSHWICNGGDNWRMSAYLKKDGTPLVTAAAGRLIAVQFLKSGTSYTRTAGCTNALVYGRGGGGAGGGASANNGSAGGGGGQGGASWKWIAPGATETYAIGAGGTAGAAGAAGNAGGNTTFGAHITASGGGGGGAGTSSTGGIGGAGGAAASGDLNIPGEPGTGQHYFGASGVSLRGGNGGGEGAGLGAAPSGGAAGAAGAANTGGGGGGGASGGTAQAGGAGGSGFIIVWEYSA